ncbi:MAG: hydrolase TatD [Paenibacillus sp. RIFOXYA1_FULL_44_5]|nr:MAG: hydrolase TatD [Paenibacillus sp. RIFOXYA1_FULL_44_5]
MLTDTHTHLDAEQFDQDRSEVIQRAYEQGVTRMINVGFNRETIPSTLQLTQDYDFIYGIIGWHPVDAIYMKAEDLDWIEELARNHNKVVALGEMGLDYHWDTSPRDVQEKVFREQIRLARKLSMPIVIHNRDAHQDIVRILREEKAEDVGGVMHSFSGSWETAQMCMDMNFYLSFGGPITFKNAKQPKEVVSKVPMDKLLMETDSPYLTPQPFRGKRNESLYVKYVAEEAANIRGVTLEEIAKITTENALKLFHMS